jgi:ribose-phosphate pyrophosphokinase
MIEQSGAHRILTVDLHADQIQGFFDIPVDNVYSSPILLGDVWRQQYKDLIVVSPDVGGVVRARALAKRLDDADLAIIDKRRPKANVSEIMHIIGDVEGRTCVLIDDLVDTAGTLCHAAAALKKQGAIKVVAYCTHAVLSGSAMKNINGSELDELVVTDTIPLSQEAVDSGRIRQLSVAEMLAETIRRIAVGESVSSLYVD